MTHTQLLESAVSHNGFCPLSGRCIIKFDDIPSMVGLLHIPDTARRLRDIHSIRGGQAQGDVAFQGEVLAMTPRKLKSGEPGSELFKVGDKVWVMLLMEDLDERIICTRIERVYAVLES